MKPKTIIICSIITLALVLCILFAFALQRHKVKKNKIEFIPQVTLESIYGEEFVLSDLHPERKTAILFFSHDCEFCQKEIEGILANTDKFEGVKWIFVTPSPREDLDLFLLKYPIDNIQDSKLCVTENPEVFIALDVKAPPTLFVYDSEGKLEQYEDGAVSIKTILEWLE